ncbi:RDD family protein [Spirochaetia bacterium]|nr:RDD family protein [Spirochaetia bacterium]
MNRPGYAYTDSSLGVETPEGIEFVLFPAGPLIRSCAWGIDQLIQWTLILILSIVSGVLGRRSGGLWLLLILFFCIDWFYHVIWEVLFRGQSPGKRIMGIRVVGSGGEPVSPGGSFLRNLLRFADTFLFLYPIVLVCMSASQGFRRLGDWAGGTLVVYTGPALPRFRPAAVPPVPGLAGLELPGRRLIGTLSFEEKQAILMFARRYPLLGKARADEIAAAFTAQLRDPAAGDGTEGPSPSAFLLGVAQVLENGASPGATPS